MSIYVIRYGDLLKIGYSSDLSKRVRAILWGIPGQQASFVGHMRGDRDVEAHLHLRFEGSRFSGEWFRETPELLAFCEIVLTREMPEAAARVTGSRRGEYNQVASDTKVRLREYALVRWPEKSHQERTDALAEALGWRRSRLHGFYHGDGRCVLRSTEADQLDELMALHRTRTPGGRK